MHTQLNNKYIVPAFFWTVVFLIIIPCMTGYAQSNSAQWQTKVHNTVFKELSRAVKAEVLIELWNQAELTPAKSLLTKAEKGFFVYEKLNTVAKSDQKEIISWLEANQIPNRPFWIVNAIWANCSLEQIEYLAGLSSVRLIQSNIKLRRAKIIETETYINPRNPETIEWGIIQINADDVWALGYSGSGVVVGGQDTGYEWEHEALKDKYRGWDGNTADHNYNWHDAIHEIDAGNTGTNPCGLDSPEPCDDHYHGTHTMGTMVGSSGSNEIGVAPDAKWIGCRNMERGDGTPTTYLECFEWFLAPTDLNDQNPDPSKAPHVINNSWSCPPSEGCDDTYDFSIMETAITNLKNAGVVVVVSAGNSGSGCSTIDTPPALYEASFTVGATNSSDVIAGFSSRGPTANYGSPLLKPNVSAPGVNVRSSKLNNTYGLASGTSMAGPHVAGVVALLISAQPSLEGDVDGIEDILEQSTLQLTSSQSCGGVSGTSIPNNTYGFGRVDALAAINMAQGNLPLNILSFEGNAYEKHIELSWEIDNIVFVKQIEIEKSQDKKYWERIGIIPVNGRKDYIFQDKNPGTQPNYYQLKIVDFDATFSVSELVVVSPLISIISDLYPNPVSHSKLHVQLQLPKQHSISYSISRSDGQVLWTKFNYNSVFQNRIEISVNNLTNGLYYLTIRDSRSKRILQQAKFIKM